MSTTTNTGAIMKISYYINTLYTIATIKIRLMMLSYQLINHRIQNRFYRWQDKNWYTVPWSSTLFRRVIDTHRCLPGETRLRNGLNTSFEYMFINIISFINFFVDTFFKSFAIGHNFSFNNLIKILEYYPNVLVI